MGEYLKNQAEFLDLLDVVRRESSTQGTREIRICGSTIKGKGEKHNDIDLAIDRHLSPGLPPGLPVRRQWGKRGEEGTRTQVHFDKIVLDMEAIKDNHLYIVTLYQLVTIFNSGRTIWRKNSEKEL